MQELTAQMANCPTGKPPQNWINSFLDERDPVLLEPLKKYSTVCHFPTRGGHDVLAVDTVKKLFTASISSAYNSPFFIGTSTQRAIWLDRGRFEGRFYGTIVTQYQDMLTFKRSSNPHFRKVERLLPRLFALPQDKTFFLFKSPHTAESIYTKLSHKSCVNRTTVYHFEELSGEGLSLKIFMSQPKQRYKQWMIQFLAKYIEEMGSTWENFLCIDPVVLSCRVSIITLDFLDLDVLYKITTLALKTFSLNKYWIGLVFPLISSICAGLVIGVALCPAYYGLELGAARALGEKPVDGFFAVIRMQYTTRLFEKWRQYLEQAIKAKVASW